MGFLSNQDFFLPLSSMKLATLHAHTRDKFIEFDEGPHIYTIKGDSSFTSVTTWNHSHFPHFDADKIIAKMMSSKWWSKNKYYGMTPDEIKQVWETNRVQAAQLGTEMHNQIELFYNDVHISKPYSTEFTYFLQFHKDTANFLEPYRTEWMIYDEELKLAGSIDMVFRDSKSGVLHIYDWKRCKEIKDVNKYQSACTPCIQHLPDSNFWHYSLQLNTYKYILEKNYNVTVGDLYLVCMHPTQDGYKKYPVSNMTTEIHDLMDLRKRMLTGTYINPHTLATIEEQVEELDVRMSNLAAKYDS